MDSKTEETEEKKDRKSIIYNYFIIRIEILLLYDWAPAGLSRFFSKIILLNLNLNSEVQDSIVIDIMENNGQVKYLLSDVASCNKTARDHHHDGIERCTTWISFHHFVPFYIYFRGISYRKVSQ